MLTPSDHVDVQPLGDRLIVGEYCVDIRAREVLRGSARRGKRLSVKALAVLIALARHPNRVLTREELMDAVWPKTYPTGDVLTQAISQLRAAFRDSPERPVYVETVARSGYRMLQEPSWQSGSPPSIQAAAGAVDQSTGRPDDQPVERGALAIERDQPRARSLRHALLGIAAVLALMLLAGMLWRPIDSIPSERPAQTPPDRREPLMLTSHLASERFAAISPDGRHVVFVADRDGPNRWRLYLQPVDTFNAVPLTTPGEGKVDLKPRWSPDGRELAFVRCAVDRRCELMRMPALGGPGRTIAENVDTKYLIGFDWRPDGKAIVMGGRPQPELEDGRLAEVDIESGVWRPLDYPWQPGDTDLSVRYSPDGKWMAFRRGTWSAGLLAHAKETGELRRITQQPTDIRGFTWSHDSLAVIASTVDRSGGRIVEFPIAGGQTRDLGIRWGVYPDVALRVPQMVYETSGYRYRMWRLDLATGESVEQLASSGSNMIPSISPDGSRVAFLSDRSGRLLLWIASTEEGAVAQAVDGLDPKPRFTATWSPDGSKLLLACNDGESNPVCEVDVASLRVRKIPLQGDVRHAIYLPQGQLAVTLMIDDVPHLRRADAVSGRVLEGPEIADVGYALFDLARQRVLYTHTLSPGLFSADLALANSQPLLAESPLLQHYKGWTIMGDTLFMLDYSEDSSVVLVRHDLEDPSVAPRFGEPLSMEQEVATSIAASSDGTYLWYSSYQPEPQDIALLSIGIPREDQAKRTD